MQLCGVLGQPAVADLDVAELPFDHPERVLDPGTHLRFERFDPLGEGPLERVPCYPLDRWRP